MKFAISIFVLILPSLALAVPGWHPLIEDVTCETDKHHWSALEQLAYMQSGNSECTIHRTLEKFPLNAPVYQITCPNLKTEIVSFDDREDCLNIVRVMKLIRKNK